MTTDPKKMPDDPRPRCGDVWVIPNTSTRVNGPNDAKHALIRHYQCGSVEDAIKAWGGLEKDAVAATKAAAIVRAAAEALRTSVFESFFVDSRGYVTFVFENNKKYAGAVVTGGAVDHFVELPGSVKVEGKTYWRTFLPTHQNSAGVNKSGQVETVLCPNCFLKTPIHGECGCGWNPREATENYEEA